MFDLPDTFKEKNEDYVVIGAMKNFIKCRPNLKGRLSDNRNGLIKSIVDYANKSETSKEETLNWIDLVVKEGVKDLCIKGLTEDSLKKLENINEIYDKISPELDKVRVNHLCGNLYDENLSLVRFQVQEQEALIYTFYLCQTVYIYDGKNDEKVRLYPVCVDIYPNEGLIIGRGKPRQNMYRYDKKGFDANKAEKINAEFKVQKSMQYILDLLDIQCKSVREISWYFKNCLYKLLDKYTQTPPEIVALIAENKNKINTVIDTVSDEICTKGDKSDISSDIMNLVEKYFSITYEDKSIFTKGKEAYPLRISATDEEESTVDQKSALERPLQSKALFFDNKKMMQKNKICDGVVFKFRRKSKKYFEEEFKVRILIKNNCCYFKFFEYTEEVDIQNVLQLFINS